MKVGDRIRKLREAKDYSQEYVAEKLGMSPNGYGNIERNQVKVNLDRLEKIAEVLGCSVLDFIEQTCAVILGDNNQNFSNDFNIYNGEIMQAKEIEYLKTEIQHLKDKIKLLEKLAGIDLN